MNLGNPYDFDEIKVRAEPLRILVISDSVREQIKQKEAGLLNLCGANVFDAVEILFTPTEDTEVEDIISSILKCEIGAYSIGATDISEFITFRCSAFSSIIKLLRPAETAKSQLEKVEGRSYHLIEKHILTGEGIPFDYIVLDEVEVNYCPPYSRARNAGQVLEFIRLYLLNRQLFYVHKNFLIDELFYYLYRVRTNFPHYQRIWSSCYKEVDEISEWAHSLGMRLELYCRTIDQCKLNSLKTATHSNARKILIDVSGIFFVCTGIFDNLAWLIDRIYALELKQKSDVSLKITRDKKSKLNIILNERDGELSEFLEDELTQKKMSFFYPIRNSMAHRKIIESTTYHDSKQDYKQIMLILAEDTYSALNDLSSKHADKFIAIGNEYMIPAFIFVEVLDEIFLTLVNSILSLLRADGEKGWDEPAYKLFNWPYEPFYF